MELIFLWVEKYKNIENQGFNFSPRFECKYENNRLTICDKKEIIPIKYDYIDNFFDDLAKIKLNNKYGCINKSMELKVKPIYDKIYFQQENFLRTQNKGKWGYLDNNCNILIKPIYDYGYDFANNMAKVIIDGKIAYLDPSGKLITKPIFTIQSNSF